MLGFGQMWPGPNRAILHDKTPFEPVRASVAAGAVDIDDTFTLRLAAGTLATEARGTDESNQRCVVCGR